jgi:hypothetical protein
MIRRFSTTESTEITERKTTEKNSIDVERKTVNYAEHRDHGETPPRNSMLGLFIVIYTYCD